MIIIQYVNNNSDKKYRIFETAKLNDFIVNDFVKYLKNRKLKKGFIIYEILEPKVHKFEYVKQFVEQFVEQKYE